MPLLSFQEQFVKAVENGLDLRADRPLRHPGVEPKTQTIRAPWKNGHNPHRVGVTEKFWTRVRTPERRKLGEAECIGVWHVTIGASGICLSSDHLPEPIARTGIGAEHEALCDGFENWAEMRDWFEKNHGLPFEGVLIQW